MKKIPEAGTALRRSSLGQIAEQALLGAPHKLTRSVFFDRVHRHPAICDLNRPGIEKQKECARVNDIEIPALPDSGEMRVPHDEKFGIRSVSRDEFACIFGNIDPRPDYRKRSAWRPGLLSHCQCFGNQRPSKLRLIDRRGVARFAGQLEPLRDGLLRIFKFLPQTIDRLCGRSSVSAPGRDILQNRMSMGNENVSMAQIDPRALP